MTVLSKSHAVSGLVSTASLVALALAIREHGQKAAGAALKEDSQFMTKKQGNKQKVAVNKVHTVCLTWSNDIHP
jgi:hypothetical protein